MGAELFQVGAGIINFHATEPPGRRAQTLNDLVCIAYEDRTLNPLEMDDIHIDEPLKNWFSAHI